MKLSMWMIADRLKKYQPECAITDGTARIVNMQFHCGSGEPELLPDHVYVLVQSDTLCGPGTIVLRNCGDQITVPNGDINDILNDLLAVFRFYNLWEKDLWEAAARKSAQEIVDLGHKVLENPMIFSDLDGNILAMTSAYEAADINEYWAEAKDTRRVPISVAGEPALDSNGQPASWSDTPAIFKLSDGTQSIACFLSINDDRIAYMNIWSHTRPIRSSDLYLASLVQDALLSIIKDRFGSSPIRPGAAMLSSLLDGAEISEEVVHNLLLRCKNPWQLLIIDNPGNDFSIYQRNLIQRLLTAPHPSIPLIYENRVVVLTSENCCETLLHSVLGSAEKKFYQAACSLPFDDLRLIRSRYDQTLFTLKQANGKPGFYQSEDQALQYLLTLLAAENKNHALIHPGLHRLKQHDTEKNSALYETLYQYLLNERSILLSAQAMHIHKNSFMYRLQKIRSILPADLDDPAVRNYLLLSYLLDRS